MIKSEKIMISLLKVGIVAYGIFLYYGINMRGSHDWAQLLIPIVMELALFCPRPEAWVFLRAAFLLQAFWYGLVLAQHIITLAFLKIGITIALFGQTFFFLWAWNVIKQNKHLFSQGESYLPNWRNYAFVVLAVIVIFNSYIGRFAMPLFDKNVIYTGEEIHRIAFSSDSGKLAIFISSGIDSGNIQIWNLRTKTPIKLSGQKDVLTGIAISPDGNTAAAGRQHDFSKNEHINKPDIYLWDIANGQRHDLKLPDVINMQNKDKYRVVCAAFSPAGEHLAVVPWIFGNYSGKRFLEIWNVAERKREQIIPIDLERIGMQFEHLTYSPRGDVLAFSSSGKLIFVNILDGSIKRVLYGDVLPSIEKIQFTSDGKYVAVASNKRWEGSKSGSHKGFIDIWEVGTGKLYKTFQWDSDEFVKGIAYSPDGKYIVSFLEHRGDVATIWDVAAGAVVCEVQGAISGREVTEAAFSPDGQWLAVCNNGYIKLYEVAKLKI